MTFFILAEIATYSFDGELIDVEFDIFAVEANNETSAREGLRLFINETGRSVGKMEIEDVCQSHLSDVID